MNLFNLFASLKLDSTDYEKGINNATQSNKDFESSVDKTKASVTAYEKEIDSTSKATQEHGTETEKTKKKQIDFNTILEKSEKIADGVQKGLNLMYGGIALVGGGLLATGLAADEFNKASNQLQSSTGATNEEMKELDSTMKAIYNNNFGEDWEDIANSLSEVRKQTGLTGDELQKTTENAFLLRDTFEWEVNESIRAADMLMKSFGLSSDEAFELITQGAQDGLDKNQNLLDSINEYSIHFEQLGFDAEDMFNMFSNGAEAGVFDIDKLGDAVKEFGIRVKDQSDATQEAFDLLELDNVELENAFREGGQAAEDAFFVIMDRLKELEDPLLQNQIGVALWGTMWEDMGADAVFALANVEGEMDAAGKQLDEMNSIKYDDFGSAMAGIKRQLETGLIIPLGDYALPYMREFGDYIAKNMPAILENGEKLIDKFGDAMKWVADNAEWLVPTVSGATVALQGFSFAVDMAGTISTVSGMISTLTTALGGTAAATAGATTATTGFTAALLANPIGLIVGAVLALGAGLVALYHHNEEFRVAFNDAWASIQESFQKFADAFMVFWDMAMPYIQPIIDFISSYFILAFSMIADYIGFVVSVFTGDWEGAKEYFLSMLDNLLEYWMSIWDLISEYGQMALDFFTSLLQGVIDWVLANWDNLLLYIMNPFLGIFALLYDNFDGFRNFANGFTEDIKDFFWSMVDRIVIFFTVDIPNAFIAFLESMVQTGENIKSSWTEIIETIKTKTGEIVDNIIKFFTEDIPKAVTDLIGKMSGYGADIVRGLWDGIQSLGSWLEDQVTDWFDDIWSSVKSIFGDKAEDDAEDYYSSRSSGESQTLQTTNNNSRSISYTQNIYSPSPVSAVDSAIHARSALYNAEWRLT